jgi:D-serine dehydratase
VVLPLSILCCVDFVLFCEGQVKIIGVEPTDANAMALSLHHGRRVSLQQVGGFADGVAVKVVGEETFQLCRELLDGVVLVNRDAICAAIKVLAICSIRCFTLPWSLFFPVVLFLCFVHPVVSSCFLLSPCVVVCC